MNTRERVKKYIEKINEQIAHLNKCSTCSSDRNEITVLKDLRDMLFDCLEEIPVYFEPAPPEYIHLG